MLECAHCNMPQGCSSLYAIEHCTSGGLSWCFGLTPAAADGKLMLFHMIWTVVMGCREEALDCGSQGIAACGRLYSLEPQAPGAGFSRSVL